jgi:O-antigen ligase
VLSAVFGIVRQVTQHGPGFLLTYLNAGGGFGQFINRNHFAFLVEAAMGLLIGLALLRRDGHERALIYFSAMLLLWVALVMSHSRGGLLAITIQAICGAFFLIGSGMRARGPGRSSPRWATSILAIGLATLAMLIITVAGVVWLGGDQLSTGVETATIELSHENSAHEGTRRSDIWRATWRMARAHPLAGAGLGGFWAELPQYHDGSGTSTPQQAHNDYLELLASGGLLGAAILIWFVVLLLRSARSAFQQEPGFQRGAALGALLGLIAIAVHSLVEFGLHVSINALVFMMLLAILSLPRIDQRGIAQAHRNLAFN